MPDAQEQSDEFNFSGEINIDVPEPPSELSYSDFEDYRNREMLKINGISLTESDLIKALKHPVGVMQSAAAHTIGSAAYRTAAADLIKLLSNYDDIVKAEAAYALARMGFAEGVNALKEGLGYSIDANVSPPLVAGYLAQLGDKKGFPVVEKSLVSPHEVLRMVACKQLFFFVRFQGESLSDNRLLDVIPLFTQALADSMSSMQWQALVQLRELRLPWSSKILEAFAQKTSDAQLREMARQIILSLPN